jgi:hypothetical protein
LEILYLKGNSLKLEGIIDNNLIQNAHTWILDKVWSLLQIGVGGYGIGRSAEKIAESKWGSK